ncbi:MAG: hypothetical protein IJ468_02110 [Lachnospiraceae bacterium]|nr:hypothetical protein [Lachnospiraceae bacterium]
MNDILMICLLAGILFLTGCLIQSIRRMTASDSRRIRWCRQTAAIVIFCAVLLLLPVRTLLLERFQQLMESGILAEFRTAVFVRRNYQLQYVLLFYLYANLIILFLGWLILSVLNAAADRGEVLVFRKLPPEGKLLHLPWVLADLCYEEKEEGMVLRPWAAVLGKWMKNLSSLLLLLAVIQAFIAILALYIRIPWLNQAEGAAFFSASYLVPSIPWLFAEVLAGFLKYCPKERPDRKREKKQEKDLQSEELYRLLMEENNVAVTGTVFDFHETMIQNRECEWLTAFLFDGFQKRRRCVFVCRDEEEKRQWEQYLCQSLSHTFDRIPVIRIGGVMEIQNQQDMDLLLVTGEQLAALEPDRVYPFWYREARLVVLTDTHPLLAKTGRTADAVFALWNKKEEPVQYLFLQCTGSGQEQQALRYYAAEEVTVFGDSCQRMQDTAGEGNPAVQEKESGQNYPIFDLVCWCLDSQQGRMRRLLFAMEQEGGVSEQWIRKQQERFGMENLGTEEFLTHVLHVVFPGIAVSNLYDTFLFQEEAAQNRSSWTVRLTDRGALALLSQAQEEETDSGEQGIPVNPFAMTRGNVLIEDQIFHVSDLSPLLADLDQEKKRLILYQAVMSCEKKGVFSFPAREGGTDYSLESYLEEKKSAGPYEVTMLRIVIPPKHPSEESSYLSALLSLVCSQVLRELFPWNPKEAVACCDLETEQRCIFNRVRMNEEDRPAVHCITVDILETGKREAGLTAVLRINSRELFCACRNWLLRVRADVNSEEGRLMAYAHQQLGKSMEEWDGTGKLLELLK